MKASHTLMSPGRRKLTSLNKSKKFNSFSAPTYIYSNQRNVNQRENKEGLIFLKNLQYVFAMSDLTFSRPLLVPLHTFL